MQFRNKPSADALAGDVRRILAAAHQASPEPEPFDPGQRSLFRFARALAAGRFEIAPRLVASHIADFGSLYGVEAINAIFVCRRYLQTPDSVALFDDLMAQNAAEPWAFLMRAALAVQESDYRLANDLARAAGIAPTAPAISSHDPYRDPLARQSMLAAYRENYCSALPFASDVGASGRYYESLIVREIERGARRVINVGCFVPFIDHRLALRYPDVQFIGIDRDREIIDFSRDLHAPNLKLIAADAGNALRGLPPQAHTLLCHLKTAIFLSGDQVENLYQAAHDAGIERLLAVEIYGISRAEGRFVDPRQPFASLSLRDGMFLHDYRGHMESAAYSTEAPAQHPLSWLQMGINHLDLHLLTVRGQRSGQ